MLCCSLHWKHSSICCVNPCARCAHGFTQLMLKCWLQQSIQVSRLAQPAAACAIMKMQEGSVRMRASIRIFRCVVRERGADDVLISLRTTLVSTQDKASSPCQGGSHFPPPDGLSLSLSLSLGITSRCPSWHDGRGADRAVYTPTGKGRLHYTRIHQLPRHRTGTGWRPYKGKADPRFVCSLNTQSTHQNHDQCQQTHSLPRVTARQTPGGGFSGGPD